MSIIPPTKETKQALELHILMGLRPHPIHMMDLRFESFKNATDIAPKSFIQNNLLLCPVAGSSERHFYQATRLKDSLITIR